MRVFAYFCSAGLLHLVTWAVITVMTLRCILFKPWALSAFFGILRDQLPAEHARIKQELWKIINE